MGGIVAFNAFLFSAILRKNKVLRIFSVNVYVLGKALRFVGSTVALLSQDLKVCGLNLNND